MVFVFLPNLIWLFERQNFQRYCQCHPLVFICGLFHCRSMLGQQLGRSLQLEDVEHHSAYVNSDMNHNIFCITDSSNLLDYFFETTPYCPPVMIGNFTLSNVFLTMCFFSSKHFLWQRGLKILHNWA